MYWSYVIVLVRGLLTYQYQTQGCTDATYYIIPLLHFARPARDTGV